MEFGRDGDHFDSLLNFRDVGAFVNAISPSSKLRPQSFYRSARPDGATPKDRQILIDKYHIKTIIDLRSKTEHINAAKKYSDVVAHAQSAAVPSTNDVVSAPLQIPGISYAEVNLNGKGFERSLVWKLSYSSLVRLVWLMALGYRTEGIAVLGKEVMQPRGLIGLGIDTLDHSGPEIKETFDILADASSYPILIHCTQGKDRTGLIVILALLLCGVDVKAISADYTRSEEELLPEKAERMKEIASIGLDESFAGCPPNFVSTIVSHLDENYGGVELYLQKIGVSNTTQNAIRRILKDGA